MKTTKKFLAFLLVVPLLCMALPQMVFASAVYNVSTAEELATALGLFGNGDTIKLEADINYNRTAENADTIIPLSFTGRTLTFDLNGKTLNSSNTTDHGMIIQAGSIVNVVDTAGGGAFNINNTVRFGLYIDNGELNTAENAVFNAVSNADYGVYVSNNGKATLTGAKGVGGAWAESGGRINVLGDVEGVIYGACAFSGATVTVGGNVEVNDEFDYLHGCVIVGRQTQINGKIKNITAAVYCESASVHVKGDVYAYNMVTGTHMFLNCEVEIDGNLTVSGEETVGVIASTGDVTGPTFRLGGDLNVSGERCIGMYTSSYHSSVKCIIDGNMTVSGEAAEGVNSFGINGHSDLLIKGIYTPPAVGINFVFGPAYNDRHIYKISDFELIIKPFARYRRYSYSDNTVHLRTDIINARLSPACSFFYKDAAADVASTITWKFAESVTDVKAGGVSIGAENYSVSGDVLTISKEYLAAQAVGDLPLTVIFDEGEPAVLTVLICNTANPVATINPIRTTYDRTPGMGADVSTTVTLNGASSITDITYQGSSIGSANYSIDGDTLTIKKEFFETKGIGELPLAVKFSTGDPALLTVDILAHSACVTPENATFYKDLGSQLNVFTFIEWNDALSFTDIKLNGISVPAANYSLEGTSLVFRRTYLNTMEPGEYHFIIEFDEGEATDLVITVTPVDSPACEITGWHPLNGFITGVYPSFQEAVNQLFKNDHGVIGGETTIKLFKDINYNKSLIIGGRITFDLNGHDLNIVTDEGAEAAVEVCYGGNIFLEGEGEFNIVGSKRAMWCYGPGEVTVTSLLSTESAGLQAEQKTVTVRGDVVGASDNVGVLAFDGAQVTVGGNAWGDIGAQIDAYEDEPREYAAKIEIMGDLIGTTWVDPDARDESEIIVHGVSVLNSDLLHPSYWVYDRAEPDTIAPYFTPGFTATAVTRNGIPIPKGTSGWGISVTGKTILFTKTYLKTLHYGTNFLTVSLASGERTGIFIKVVDSTSYSVTYDANGGSGTVPTEGNKVELQTFAAASHSSLTAPEGKKFNMWNTKADGSGMPFLPGNTIIMPAQNITLYAIWVEITLGERFEAENAVLNNAKINNSVESQGTSGHKFVYDINKVGISSVQWNNLPPSTMVEIRYASMESGTTSLYVNGVHTKDVAFTSTGGWSRPAYFASLWVPLEIADGDSLKIQYDSGDAVLNLDYIECYSSAFKNSTVSPASATFYKNNPADMTAAIEWNFSSRINEIKANGTPLSLWYYTVGENTLTIKKEYLMTADPGDLVLNVAFNKGAPATLTVAVNGSAGLSPANVVFDRNPDNSKDVVTVINWNNARAVTDVLLGETSIGSENYSIENGILTIRKDRLALIPYGNFALTVVFDEGDPATLAVSVMPENACVTPDSVIFKLDDPAEVSTTVTWNDAEEITGIVYGSYSLTESTDFSVNDDTLTISEEFLSGLHLSNGDTVEFVILFDKGESAILTIKVTGFCSITFDANGGEGGTTITAHYGDPLVKPFVKREGYTLVGWKDSVSGEYVAIPETATVDATYVADWVETSMTVKHAGDDKIAVEIRGFSTTYNYQIWSYQRVTSDLELNGGEDVPANQWALSMPYTPCSAGSASGSTLTFLIDKFQSPNGNYGIVLKIADEEQRYLYELANSYTSGDIGEAKITKIYVDGEYVKGSAQDDNDPYTDIRLVKDIADGSTTIKVIGNLEDLIYSATVVETAEDLTATNGNEFTWDISSLEPRTYTVKVKTENETSSDTRTLRFTLFTLEETEYAEIDELEVTGGGVISNLYNILTTNIGIKPGSNKLGYFFYRIGEPGRKAQIKSGKSYNDAGQTQAMDAYGYYQLTGLVSRDSGLANPGGWDDGIIKFFSIKRSSAPSNITVEVNGNGGNSFTLNKGTPITVEANANIAGIGSEAVQYSFWRYDAKGYVLVKDWSSDNFLTWTPGKVGDYNIQVRAKGELAKSYEVAKSVAVSIVDPIDSKANGVTITVNEAELNANAKAHVPIMIKANATSSTDESLLYKFYIHDEFMLTQQLRNYSPSGDVLWTPRKAGTYEIMVLVKNQVSYGKYDAIKRVTVTVE